MKNDSHDLRTGLQDLNKKTGPLFKLDNDPRLLPGSQKLRKYSIDELPQLINVIKGQMSIVGPRPLFEEDTILFDENYMRRLNVLPGMTGLLQINDRNTDDFETWFRYDLEYENWSLLLDLAIILKLFLQCLKEIILGFSGLESNPRPCLKAPALPIELPTLSIIKEYYKFNF